MKLSSGVTHRPIGFMLERANAILPFSEATGILDDGCGPGSIMARLIQDHGAQLPQDCQLLCTDFSAGMLKQVEKQKFAAAADSPWTRLEVKLQDATNLDAVETGSKSHVTAGMVFFMTSDPLKCLTETRRVLKDGGVAAISSWDDNQWMQLMGMITVVRPDKQLPEIPKEWRSTSGLEGEMKKAGFKDVEGHMVSVEMAVQSYESFVDFLFKAMPHMIALREDMSEAEMAKLHEVTIARMKEMCPSVPGKLTGEVVVGFGRK